MSFTETLGGMCFGLETKGRRNFVTTLPQPIQKEDVLHFPSVGTLKSGL